MRISGTAAALGGVIAARTGGAVEHDLIASNREAQDLPFLLDLPVNRNNAAAVRYTPGSLDRASHIQDRYSLLAVDFAKWGNRKLPLLVILLSRDDWQQLGVELPYGFPVRMANGSVLLAAWGDRGTVELWRHLLGDGLPLLEGTPLRGTPEEASSLLITDLLGLIEAARGLLGRAGFGAREPRLNDFMAHTLALSAILEHDRERLTVLDEIFRQLASAPSEIPGAEATLGGWLRFQADAYWAARQVATERGAAGARQLLKLARKNGGALSREDLRRRFPELESWLAGL